MQTALQKIDSNRLLSQLLATEESALRGLRELTCTRSQSVEQLLQRLRELYRENRIDECVEVFETLLESSAMEEESLLQEQASVL